MATFFQSVRQGFGRGGNNKNNNNNNHNNNNNNNSPKMNNNNNGTQNQQSGPVHPQQAAAAPPGTPGVPPSPSVVTNMSNLSIEGGSNNEDSPKYFFQEKYASLNVKGNFLTLCACPKNVELGEWIAHQIVEQYRLLHGMLQVIQEVNTLTGQPICNETTCPTMSAGRLTYTWLVDGKAAKISAPKFINRVEKWIVSKIHDPVMFPTDPPKGTPQTWTLQSLGSGDGSTPAASNQTPAGQNNDSSSTAVVNDWIGKSSGFPPTFYKDCQGIMKQMFRCYAHLYHGHWLDPFWNLNRHEILNMAFVHFVTVAKYYRLVADKEMEPMQPLIDLFVKQEKIPPEALAGHWASQEATTAAPAQASSPAPA
ncbi:hypothetical protein VTN77DRAFT_3059 [Rasamsonia byssochlamydoides]|uniref:uncharacterized protein n=1 Tax=Rasamsonia byssochlamydoides TaxID=89139 RepID=UPI003743EF45